jgi:hypothetical protein
VTTELPRSVTSIDDLVDPNMVKQGEPGYSNPPIFVGDILLTVDGYNVEVYARTHTHLRTSSSCPNLTTAEMSRMATACAYACVYLCVCVCK